ncbi:MAG: hypothetical protein MI673_06245, partial [Thiotrichales bacterium]|nr:hypothetical protein [Thiotrichales bacterium]
PPGVEYVPPVHADLSILTGQAARDTYAGIAGRVVYKGIAAAEREMSLAPLRQAERELSVGIFLTAMTDMAALEAFSRRLCESLAVKRLLLRPHPVRLVQDDYEGLAQRVSAIDIDKSASATEAAEACDFVVCGNSGVVLEVLKAGVPVAYNADLDTIPDDYCGFVAAGLVPRCEAPLEDLPAQLAAFFGRDDWPAKMAYFDHAYGKDADAVMAEAVRELERLGG